MKNNTGVWRWSVLLLAIAVAAGAAAVATAGNGRHASKQMVTLKHRIARLKAQNRQLDDRFSPAGIRRQLAKTKQALDRYQDVTRAEADGYKPESPCESTATDPEMTSYGGAMGIHYVNDSIARSGRLVATKPAILVYLPTGNGVQLVAAEYFRPDADQNVQTDGDRPSLFGRAFDGPMLGHAPGMPIHYDLHVWLWKHNPSGLFAPWNPDASCP
jgi:hypothetical protein